MRLHGKSLFEPPSLFTGAEWYRWSFIRKIVSCRAQKTLSIAELGAFSSLSSIRRFTTTMLTTGQPWNHLILRFSYHHRCSECWAELSASALLTTLTSSSPSTLHGEDCCHQLCGDINMKLAQIRHGCAQQLQSAALTIPQEDGGTLPSTCNTGMPSSLGSFGSGQAAHAVRMELD